MKKMKISVLSACIAGNLVYFSLNQVTAQEITFPDAPSRIKDSVSGLKVSQASTAGTLAKTQGAPAFARQDSAAQMAAGSLSRNSFSDNRNAVLSQSGSIGQLGRTSLSAASTPKSGSLNFSFDTTKAGNQGQISLPASQSARNTPGVDSEETSSINLNIFSLSRLAD